MNTHKKLALAPIVCLALLLASAAPRTASAQCAPACRTTGELHHDVPPHAERPAAEKPAADKGGGDKGGGDKGGSKGDTGGGKASGGKQK
jgi:hypothetical protein